MARGGHHRRDGPTAPRGAARRLRRDSGPVDPGSLLRALDHGNVAQLEAVHRLVLVGLAEQAPRLLAGGDTLAFVDID